MARVYVSSTFKDLKDCREQVRLTLRRMHHEDVAMEYYVAEDQRPLDMCLADVESCDLYICLVAWRYGYVPDRYEYSITELEYRRAVDAGKYVIALVLAEDASWPGDRYEFESIGKVQAFRQTLQRDHSAAPFTGPADVGGRVAEAIHTWGEKQSDATAGSLTDWERYRSAVFEKHRSVRLSVIAGAEQDRNAWIPLTDVFVAQRTTAEQASSRWRQAGRTRMGCLTGYRSNWRAIRVGCPRRCGRRSTGRCLPVDGAAGCAHTWRQRLAASEALFLCWVVAIAILR